jgi:hypothetical protein
MDEPVHVRAGRLRPWAAAGCRAPATTAAVRWCPTGWTAVLDRWETVEGAVKGAVWVFGYPYSVFGEPRSYSEFT